MSIVIKKIKNLKKNNCSGDKSISIRWVLLACRNIINCKICISEDVVVIKAIKTRYKS